MHGRAQERASHEQFATSRTLCSSRVILFDTTRTTLAQAVGQQQLADGCTRSGAMEGTARRRRWDSAVGGMDRDYVVLIVPHGSCCREPQLMKERFSKSYESLLRVI